MKINKEFKIWLAANDLKDESRPALNHILIERTGNEGFTQDGYDGPNGIAIAANGLMIAVVPVELENGDVPGLVRADVLQAAFKGCRGLDIQIELGNDTVSFCTKLTTMTCPRFTDTFKEHPETYTFPNWRNVIPTERDMATGPLLLSWKQLQQVCDAIGILIPKITRTYPGTKTRCEGPLILQSPKSNGKLEPPYGLVMPGRGILFNLNLMGPHFVLTASTRQTQSG